MMDEMQKTLLAQVADLHEVPEGAYSIARWHHERWDGRGYPRRTERESISALSRGRSMKACTSPLW